MKHLFKQPFFYTSIFSLIALGLIIGNFVFGWIPPTATPPSSNLPAPINAGPDPQTKSGNLTIGGNLTTAGFKMTTGAGLDKVLTTDASGVASWNTPAAGATPAGSTGYIQFNNAGDLGADSNLFWDNTNKRLGIGTINPNTKLEVAGSLTITGSSSYIKLPLLTTTQRNVISPETGMIIFNSTANEVQVYVPSEWKKFGAGAATGTACTVPGECATALCVDNYCCDTTCSGTVCQTCGLLSSNGVGHCGYVNNSSNDPRNTCTTASPPAADSCKSPNCSGTGYACGYLIGDGGQPVCKYCSGSSYDPINIAIGVQDTTTPSVCTATHYRCDGSGNCSAPFSATKQCRFCGYPATGFDPWSCISECARLGYDGCGIGHCNSGCATAYYPCDTVLAGGNNGYCDCRYYAY